MLELLRKLVKMKVLGNPNFMKLKILTISLPITENADYFTCCNYVLLRGYTFSKMVKLSVTGYKHGNAMNL
jgi:hypothetical protein